MNMIWKKKMIVSTYYCIGRVDLDRLKIKERCARFTRSIYLMYLQK